MQTFSFEATSRFVDTPKGRIHYHEAGAGPALLLIHGSGPGVTGWANFAGNLPVFAPHYRCIILDLPGYGRSDPVEGPPIPGCVDACFRLLEALKVERAHVIGNSLGGVVGSYMAAQQPARIDRFVTIGGIGVNVFTAFPGEGINLLTAFAEDPTRERIETWLRSMVFDQALITPELIETRFRNATDPVTLATSRQMYSRASINALATEFRGPNAAFRLGHLSSIQAPTLLTWGRDDRVSPLDMCLMPMRLIPHCELHVFPNCGHWAMIERKAEFESLVLAFLGRKAA
ncbi:MAG: alpha/beta fold hydrolase [Proteobacteria bacterium]|nr:alpha/beta fold hydrolase [Pseudomonadota bacterium]HQR03937.1 alpha/beta fold hydrolase [Rhodocyclaceae bacterium]